MEGMVEVGIEEGLDARNQKDWDYFGKDGEEEDLEFYRKILDDSFTLDCM